MNSETSPRIDAKEAARLLGVSVATLYAYVSRGLLASSEAGTARRKHYALDEVQRLAARRADGKRAGHVAIDALRWGLPVLETRISGIAAGRLHYRGQDSCALAHHASLETVAALLWGADATRPFAAEAPVLAQSGRVGLPRTMATQPVLLKVLASLPGLAPALPELAQAQGWRADAALMRVLAGLLLGRAPSAQPLHLQVAEAWGAGADADWIRASLVLLADHELNASTFSVRCVAATGAPRWAALCAGLAALAGPRHGGGMRAARLRLEAVLADGGAGSGEAMGAAWPGFGHPLYPEGDPRARHLLALLEARTNSHARVDAVRAITQVAAAQTGLAPNCDWALAALGAVCGWPMDAGEQLFALGRSAGWIAHAAEQAGAGELIRPRSRYIGQGAEGAAV